MQMTKRDELKLSLTLDKSVDDLGEEGELGWGEGFVAHGILVSSHLCKHS